jgi:hypothetical protein
MGDEMAHTVWGRRLEFWDVPAAVVGFAGAVLLRGVAVAGYHVLWLGAPAAFVLARRILLPQLSPPAGQPPPTVTTGRKVAAYACMIFGGFVALIAGGLFYAVATDDTAPAISWPVFAVASAGAMLAALGVRWLI